jgi:hypothetical protein
MIAENSNVVFSKGDRMSTLVGLFDQYSDAEQAVYTLEQYGVDRSQISLVQRDGEKLEHENMNAGKGAVTGAATGGVVGLLAGLSAIVIPGIGPVLATGAVASALATTLGMTAIGAGIGAAAGGLLGALVDLGLPHEEASFYAEGVKRGGVLLTVNAHSDQEERIKEILRSAGAVDMNTRRQSWENEGWTDFEETDSRDSGIYPPNRL